MSLKRRELTWYNNGRMTSRKDMLERILKNSGLGRNQKIEVDS
jgi:hypothetical protein